MAVNFEYYRVFCQVARSRSFTGAARALMSSQPSVTRCIQSLEQQLAIIRRDAVIHVLPYGAITRGEQGAELAELVFLHCLPQASFTSARTVVSVTPVVLARHYKPRQGTFREWLEAEIRRSCAEQGLPEPLSVEPLPCLPVRDGAPLLWNSFIRQRKGQPPRRGYGFRLHFAAPVPVPFAIGSLAHFGLGLFVAERPEA